METGKLEDDKKRITGSGGLCNTEIGEDALELFYPTERDWFDYSIGTSFWAAGLDFFDCNRIYKFTPLRQTIVLFLAAMNDEL